MPAYRNVKPRLPCGLPRSRMRSLSGESNPLGVPTVTELAALGTGRRAEDLEGVDPKDHIAGMKLIALANYVRREGATIDFRQGVRGIRPSEVAVLQSALDDAFRVLRDIQHALDAYSGASNEYSCSHDGEADNDKLPFVNGEPHDDGDTFWI
jgi:hypothetical protein